MKAAICVPGAGALTIESVTHAALGPRDALVRVDASGVCRTDHTAMHGQAAGFDKEPTVLGHEGAGTIMEVGEEVRLVRVGDRVIASFAPTCGRCWFCVRGMTNHCETPVSSHRVIRSDGSDVGVMAGLGTFAEFMTVHENALVPVQTDLAPAQLALIGCGVATGVGAALWTAQVTPGSDVAIFGVGGVGHFVLQGARIAGAKRIFAVDPEPKKRAHALACGATDAVDPVAGDAVAEIRDATSGRGVDYSFEVVGQPDVVRAAYAATRLRGTVIVLGMPAAGSTLSLPADAVYHDEKRIMGSRYGSVRIREHFPLLVELAERGELDIASAISHRLTLERINDAFEYLESGDAIRSVICAAPDGTAS